MRAETARSAGNAHSREIDDDALASARARMQQLFDAVKGFRMTPTSRVRSCMNAEVLFDTNVLLYTIAST
jgi:hypothetical protein